MLRRGQKLVNQILAKYPDYQAVFGGEEEMQNYLNMRARFLESVLYNMNDEEFWKALEEVENY
jgi:hypothetical protein